MRFRAPRLPWHGRRLALVGAAVVVAMGAGALTGVQIRAAQAEERREQTAALAAERTAAQEAAASRAAERAALAEVVAGWEAAAAQGEVALAGADAALAASEGKVTDDAVRQELAQLADALRLRLDRAPDEPSRADLGALEDAIAGLVAATTAVTESQAAWQAAADAAAAAEAAAREASQQVGGAGADCGGTGSYEPSDGGAGTLHTSVPTEDGDGSNGRVPRSAMTPLAWCADALGNQQWLRTDAAEALTRLNDAFRAQFGENIAVDLSYRSYDDQVRARELFGNLAARPGTSNHGWGTAIDTWEWAAYDFGSARHEWLVANGPAYGWVNPAASDPGNPEYWHFDYRG